MMIPFSDMEGRIALVTGGGQGIGEACAQTLAAHGAYVIAAGRHMSTIQAVVDKIKAAGGQGDAIVLDVSQPESIQFVFQRIADKHRRLDILVNNAGMIDRHPPEEVTVELWDKLIDTNLRGVHLMSQGCLPLMRVSGGGKIVNVTSLAGRVGGKKTAPNYAASKGGIISMTKSYALHFAPEHINVNAVAPGLIITPMTEGRNKDADIPLGRLGTAQDIADAVYFLASSLSDYITGCTLDVNGGLYMN